MKSITIIGNLGANAVLRTTSEGKQLMTFNVAVSRGENNPIWFNCVSNMREKLMPFLVKGQCVAVVGDLTPGIYNNQLDLSINVDKIELCGSAPKADAPANPTEESKSNAPAASSQQPETY